MKSLLVLSILLALGSSFAVTSSFAQEEDPSSSTNRPANPGDDPNEAARSGGGTTQAGVTALGFVNADCCEKHVVRNRLGDSTVARPVGSGGGSRPDSGNPATGTR